MWTNTNADFGKIVEILLEKIDLLENELEEMRNSAMLYLDRSIDLAEQLEAKPARMGRPKGSKNKAKALPAKKKKMGRPKGYKNKPKA